MENKFTDKQIFEQLTAQELLVANWMIDWQIEELQETWNKLNREQSKIMLRFHELENKQEQPQS